MKIFIDATGITNYETGLSKYSSLFLEHVFKINNDFNYTILINNKLKKNNKIFSLKTNNVNFLIRPIKNIGPLRDIQYIFLKNIIKEHDIFHCLSSYLPIVPLGIKTIVTIHDLKYYFFPNFLNNKFKAIYLKFILKNSVKFSNRIIAISHSTLNDLEKVFKLRQKVKVIYEASTLDKKIDPLPVEYIKDKQNFLLVISENRPHKNLHRVIHAFQKLSQKKNVPQLIIAGRGTEKLKSYLDKIGLSQKVFSVGQVSDRQIKWLYDNAVLLIFPSLYEGFGLPILEAMANGLPVLTSNMHSTKEVSDGAAFLVDPYKVDEITNGIETILKNDKLKKKLVLDGFTREKHFSWENTALETVKVYENLAVEIY